MNPRPFFFWRCPPIPLRSAVLLVVLAWSGLALCGCGWKGHVTEVHDAARNGDLKKIESLIKDSPDLVFSKDGNYYGYTPLHWAADQGHKDVVELLMANKADVNAKDDLGQTPLNLAACFGHKDVAELLLTDGANVNAKDRIGETSLHLAALNGHKDVAELLLTAKAEVDAKGFNNRTPLHLAAMKGQKGVAELLMADKADVNARDNEGMTPLRWAATNGHANVAELLRQHGGHEKTALKMGSF